MDDPIGRYLPTAGPAWNAVPVRDLLTHTAGVRHWHDRPGYVPSITMAEQHRLRLLLDGADPRAASEFRYSSPGYVIVGAVLAAAAGTDYAGLVHELVVTPLGLAATTLGGPPPGAALGHRGGVAVPGWDLGTMSGTGDVWSTVGDIARFISALHTGELLPPSVQSSLHDVHVPFSDPGSGRIRAHGYALGHFRGTVDGHPACLHPGDNPGYQSLAVWVPQTSTAAVVLANDEAVDVESEVADSLRRSLSGE